MKELKNGRSRLVDFNKDAFVTVVSGKGFGMTELSRLLEYTPNYFNKCLRTGKMGVNAMNILNSKLGIKPEMYSSLSVSDLPERIIVTPKKKEVKTAKTAKELVKEKIEARKKEPITELSTSMITVQVSLDSEQLKDLIKEAVLDAFNSL